MVVVGLVFLLLLLWVRSSFPPTCPQLPRKMSTFAGVSPIEIARTSESRRKGLMHRTSFDGGMLFEFPNERHHTFHMKDTPLPLHIDFYDRNQRLIGRREGVPFSEKPIRVPEPSCYVLETKRKNKKRY